MGMNVMVMMTSMMVETTKPDKQAPCEPMGASESHRGRARVIHR